MRLELGHQFAGLCAGHDGAVFEGFFGEAGFVFAEGLFGADSVGFF